MTSEKISNAVRKGSNPSVFASPLLWLVIILLSFFFVRMQYIGIPFERDEGAYSFFGQQILNGAIPFLDFHEMKFPFLYYFYAGIQAIFGSTLKGVQTGFLLITTANVALIYAVINKFFRSESAVIGAAGYAVLSFNTGFQAFTCQSEHALVFFLLIAALIVANWMKKGASYLLLIAGFIAGLSFQIKQTAALLVLFLGLLIIAQQLWQKKPNLLKAIMDGALFSGGFIFALGIFGLYLKLNGAWEPFIFWTFTWPQLYLSQLSFSQGMDMLNSRFGSILPGFWPLLIGGIVMIIPIFISGRSAKTKIAVAALLFLSIASIVPGLRFYGHYWIQLFPVFALVFGVGMVEIKKWLKPRLSQWRPVFYGIMMVCIFSPVFLSSHLFFNPDHTKVLRETYGMNPFPEMKEIGEFLEPMVQDGEVIAVFGSEPELYFYTNTVAPTSYSYFSHIVKNIPESQQWQADFIDSVEAIKPQFIVYLLHPVSWDADFGAAEQINQWATDYFNQNYNRIAVVDMVPGNVKYVYGQQVATFRPRSQGVIYVLQRRN